MPNKHFYFALGATHGVVMVCAIRAARRRLMRRWPWLRTYRAAFTWYFPLLIGAFGMLALVPDTLYALDVLPKSVIRGPLFNLFYGYSWFEYIEDANARVDWLLNCTGSLLLLLISMGTLLVYARRAAAVWPEDGEGA